MAALPSHRQFLARLIDSLATSGSSPPPPPTPLEQQDAEDHKQQQQLFPPASRPLLLTLHVLFPNLLLPALDLLDRHLVTRLHLASQPHDVYVVKSLATTISRRFRNALASSSTSSSSSRRYIVRTAAWNCSCASFALDAFPPSSCSPSTATPRPRSKGGATEVNPEGGPEDSAAWDFGGLSLDGVNEAADEHVPCCKHLLACLLVEHWGDILGSYAVERTVTRDELAGIIVGIS